MSGFMKTVLITTTTAWDFSKIINRLFTHKFRQIYITGFVKTLLRISTPITLISL